MTGFLIHHKKLFTMKMINQCAVSIFVSVVLVVSSVTINSPFVWIGPITKQDIKRRPPNSLKEYTQEKFLRWRFTPVENLVTYISQVVSNHNCLIIIDNSRQIDLMDSLKNPVILQSVQLLMLRHDFFSKFVQGPTNFHPRNISLSLRNDFDCPLSKYFHPSRLEKFHDTEFCYHLNILAFSTATRPWNCFVQIYKFPSDYYFDGQFWPKWRIFWYPLYHHDTIPNQFSPMIQIFVEEGEPNMNKYGKLRLTAERWGMTLIYKENRKLLSRFCHVIFFHLAVQNSSHFQPIRGNTSKIVPETGRIVHPTMLKICPCWVIADPVLHSLRFIILNDFRKLLKINLPPLHDFNWIWDINAVGSPEGNNVIGRAMHYLDFCHTSVQSSVVFSSPHERLAHASASIWLSIMSNYTVLKNKLKNFYKSVACSGPRSGVFSSYYHATTFLEFLPFAKKIQIFPYFVADKLSTMRFVSCGKRGLTTLN